MKVTVGVFGIGDVVCKQLNRLARNIQPGDVVRVDSGDGITVRWVYVQVRENNDAGRSWFRNVRQRNLRMVWRDYPKEGSSWGQPWWAPLGGFTWDADDVVEIFRPVA